MFLAYFAWHLVCILRCISIFSFLLGQFKHLKGIKLHVSWSPWQLRLYTLAILFRVWCPWSPCQRLLLDSFAICQRSCSLCSPMPVHQTNCLLLLLYLTERLVFVCSSMCNYAAHGGKMTNCCIALLFLVVVRSVDISFLDSVHWSYLLFTILEQVSWWM